MARRSVDRSADRTGKAATVRKNRRSSIDVATTDGIGGVDTPSGQENRRTETRSFWQLSGRLWRSHLDASNHRRRRHRSHRGVRRDLGLLTRLRNKRTGEPESDVSAVLWRALATQSAAVEQQTAIAVQRLTGSGVVDRPSRREPKNRRSKVLVFVRSAVDVIDAPTVSRILRSEIRYASYSPVLLFGRRGKHRLIPSRTLRAIGAV